MKKKEEKTTRTKTGFSRIVQICLRGKLLKDFDAEVIRADESESSVGRDIIRECLQNRTDARAAKNKNPFFQ